MKAKETVTAVKKTPLEIVKEIHGKVLTSSDDCINEAKRILKEDATLDLEDKKRIAALNFDKAPEVIKAREFLKTHGEQVERARIAEYFQTMYPGSKYIFREDMEKICEQYGLILGPDKMYKGEGELGIPERCLKQIMDFKLRKEDELFWIGRLKQISSERISGNDVSGQNKVKSVYEWSEITREEYEKGTANGQLVQNNKQIHYQCNKNYFTIAAPQRMFDMEGYVVENNEMKQVIEEIVGYDPVCLKVCKFGFLVISVWGEELAIQQLTNEKMN